MSDGALNAHGQRRFWRRVWDDIKPNVTLWWSFRLLIGMPSLGVALWFFAGSHELWDQARHLGAVTVSVVTTAIAYVLFAIANVAFRDVRNRRRSARQSSKKQRDWDAVFDHIVCQRAWGKWRKNQAGQYELKAYFRMVNGSALRLQPVGARNRPLLVRQNPPSATILSAASLISKHNMLRPGDTFDLCCLVPVSAEELDEIRRAKEDGASLLQFHKHVLIELEVDGYPDKRRFGTPGDLSLCDLELPDTSSAEVR